MGYPTTAELVAASDSAELEALDEARQDELRAQAIVAVENFTGQSFTVEGTELAPVERRLDGSGTDRLYLPRRLVSAASLTSDGYLLAADDFSIAPERRDAIRLTSPVGGSWVTRVRRRPSDPGPRFEQGVENVVVAGVWGWTDDEWAAGELAGVATAIRFDMEDQAAAEANALAPTIRSLRTLGVENVNQGGLAANLRPGESPISIRAQRALLRYRWRGRVGATA